MNGAIPDTAGGGVLARARALASERGLARNSMLSVVQALVQLVALLGTYRILIAWEGIEGLGVWSFLMIFVAIAALLDLSGAVGLSRLAAGFGHIFPGHSRTDVIETTLLTSLAINCALAVLVLVLGPKVVSANIEPAQLPVALAMIPWMSAIVIAMALSVGIGMALDGVLRADLRAIISAGSTLINLAVAAAAIPHWGLAGFAAAQLTQLVTIIVVGWILLRRQLPELNLLPMRWKAAIVSKTISYAAKINAQNFFQQVVDPVVRFIINAFGGSASLGLYELASKISLQLRGLALAAATPLIPVAAEQREINGKTGETLVRAHLASAAVAVAMVFAGLAAVPVLSLLMLGEVSRDLVALNCILVLGWSGNVAAIPLFIAAQATGYLRWNLLAGMSTLVAIGICTVLVGGQYGMLTFVAGVAIGLLVGATIIIIGNGNRFLDPVQARRVWLYATGSLVGSIILAMAAWVLFAWLRPAP